MSALLTTVSAAGPIAHHWGFGPGPWLFILVPLFWFLVLGLVFALVGRRRWRRHGPMSTRSAEATLAERFAQGDIEEVEYRARLEVLRANRAS